MPRAQGRPTWGRGTSPPYLDMFRGKPAITKFDRLITPSRKSSQSFATPTGAALKRSAPSACSRLAHLASGLARLTMLCHLRLPSLGSPAGSTCWPIMQKVHCRLRSSCFRWRRVGSPGPRPEPPRFPRGTLRCRPLPLTAWGVTTPTFGRQGSLLSSTRTAARFCRTARTGRLGYAPSRHFNAAGCCEQRCAPSTCGC